MDKNEKYEKSICELIEKAITHGCINPNKWITTAIVSKVEKDGYIVNVETHIRK